MTDAEHTIAVPQKCSVCGRECMEYIIAGGDNFCPDCAEELGA